MSKDTSVLGNFNKFLVYKPVDKEVIVKCSNCGKNDKLYELWLDTPVMSENASVDTVGEKYRAVYEFKCKCSLLKRTKNKIKFEVILLEMKDVDEIPENFGTF